MVALKKGRYDVARLDLQTLLNTYRVGIPHARQALGGRHLVQGSGTAALTRPRRSNDFITSSPMPLKRRGQDEGGRHLLRADGKADRDYTNAQEAEKSYREMINMFPDSGLIPRAKQKLRDVQEVLAERETEIGSTMRAAKLQRLIAGSIPWPIPTLYSRSDKCCSHRRRLCRPGAESRLRRHPRRHA